MGHSIGFVYAKDGIVQHTVMTDYASDGRINAAGFVVGARAEAYVAVSGTISFTVDFSS